MRRRIIGLETEFGLTFFPTGRGYLPMEKVIGYLFEDVIPTGWPSNAFLPNGARFYQDTGCHPEYATPECASFKAAVTHDKAGEWLLASRLGPAEAKLAEEGYSGTLYAYKNNTDSMGNTYGCHENYLVDRRLDFWQLAEQIIPYFVTRPIWCGAGKVYQVAGQTRYAITQRAGYIHEASSSSTTSSRSIINTRDEPHADAERFRRLHIIVGDSNMSEYTCYLKVGITALILSVLEEGGRFPAMVLEDPVDALQKVSTDLTLKQPLKLAGGRRMTALQMQWCYLETAERHFANLHRGPFRRVLTEWKAVLTALESDPVQLADRIDWVAKREVMRGFMQKNGCDLSDPRIAMLDLQYHDIDRARGIYFLLERQGRMRRITDDAAIALAMKQAPKDTRAHIRASLSVLPKRPTGPTASIGPI